MLSLHLHYSQLYKMLCKEWKAKKTVKLISLGKVHPMAKMLNQFSASLFFLVQQQRLKHPVPTVGILEEVGLKLDAQQ